MTGGPDVSAFQETVWEYYAQHGRHDLPWRTPKKDGSFDPYHIMVSEIMLQQTQVPRVIPKFQAFLTRFPSPRQLAQAPLSDVLIAWTGLGYNRRAKFLWQAAQRIVNEYDGRVPQSKELLVMLPGIGPNTAGAIVAYAYNQPAVFIETNIRTVFIHHFFKDSESVADKAIAELVRTTLPDNNVRSWYWALMDYGTYLKQTVGNASKRSHGYAKQSKFEGSRRQIRGNLLRTLAKGPRTEAQLVKEISDARLETVLIDLQNEGFIRRAAGNVTLA